MSQNRFEGLSSRLAHDIDCDKQIDGSMLLRRELERNPQQALQLIEREMAREQQNGSSKRLEVRCNGEIFITNYRPASGYASEGVYVGMYPGRAEPRAEQPYRVETPQAYYSRPQADGNEPPPRPYYAPRQPDYQDYSAARPYYAPRQPDYPDYSAARPYYAPRQQEYSYPSPRPPFYPPENAGNGVGSAVLGGIVGAIGGVALGLALGGNRHGGGWHSYGGNGFNNYDNGFSRWQRHEMREAQERSWYQQQANSFYYAPGAYY